MFLLNHENFSKRTKTDINLHSTMFLLNRKRSANAFLTLRFTFHYVSIKSSSKTIFACSCLDLHSTMFLLNRFSHALIVLN